MRCGFCAHEFDETEGIRGCGQCGTGSCHQVRCPRCGYHNPLEPPLIKHVKRLFGSRQQPAAEAATKEKRR